MIRLLLFLMLGFIYNTGSYSRSDRHLDEIMAFKWKSLYNKQPKRNDGYSCTGRVKCEHKTKKT